MKKILSMISEELRWMPDKLAEKKDFKTFTLMVLCIMKSDPSSIVRYDYTVNGKNWHV